MTIDADELLRRLRALDDHLATSTDLFDHFWPLELGAPTPEAELLEAEQTCGVAVPEPLRSFLLTHAGSGRFGYTMKEEHLEAFDADYTGAQGGFTLLTPAEMVETRTRIAKHGKATEGLLPFVKDHSAATWLCVLKSDDGVRVAHVQHDSTRERPERWAVDRFFDGWSASGFSVDMRWEDQPEPVVERFAEALGLESD